MRLFRPVALLGSCMVAAAVLLGCASYGPQDLAPGASKAMIVQRLGPPSMEIMGQQGVSRLVYARGPWGRHTWMLDMDAQGRLLRWHQALVVEEMMKLPPGMAVHEILFRIGPPAQRQPRGLKPGQLWSYRYPTNDCLWFQLELDERDLLVVAGTSIDPQCDAPTRGPL